MLGLTTADGRTLAYRRVGSGPVLVCHPGGPGFSSAYLGDLGGLSRRNTLILLDPRGTGRSGRPADPGAYAIADYVADLEELRGHLGCERIDLLGHSHGGMVAIAYAGRHPGRIGRLVLASTLARLHETFDADSRAAIEARAQEPWFEDAHAALSAEQQGRFESDDELGRLVRGAMPLYFARYAGPQAEFVDSLRGERFNADALRLFFADGLAALDLRGDLREIDAPVLVITGADDFLASPVCAEDIASHLADARIVVIPGCGHFPFVDSADRFRSEIQSFLDERRASPRTAPAP